MLLIGGRIMNAELDAFLLFQFRRKRSIMPAPEAFGFGKRAHLLPLR